MRKKRRVTNNGLKRRKIIREIVISIGIVALFWAWMLYTTRPATEENTYQCQGKIDKVRIDTDEVRHGQSYDVIVFLDGDCYVVDMLRGGRKDAQALTESLSEGEDVSLTVWKRPIPISQIFDYLYYHPKKQFYFLQIVEAKCGEEVVWPLETHNKWQSEMRVLAYIAGAVVTLLVGGWELMNWKFFYPRRNKRKKRGAKLHEI